MFWKASYDMFRYIDKLIRWPKRLTAIEVSSTGPSFKQKALFWKDYKI